MSIEKEEPLEPLNTRLPSDLNKEVKKAAVDAGLKLQGLSKLAFKLVLYFRENVDAKETNKLAQMCFPLACLRTARNDLAKQGHDTSGLDLEIAKAEEFLNGQKS